MNCWFCRQKQKQKLKNCHVLYFKCNIPQEPLSDVQMRMLNKSVALIATSPVGGTKHLKKCCY